MKHAFAFVASVAALVAFVLLTTAPRANAIPQFKKEFETKYVKPDSTDAKEKAFAQAVDKAKCNVCHAGTTKKERNTYGQALAKLLDRKTDQEDQEKIRASLEKVAAMKTKPDDPKAPTFGEIISSGKLPGETK